MSSMQVSGPFDYLTVRSAAPGSPDGDVTTYRLVPKDDGTELLVSTPLNAGVLRRRLARQAVGRRLDRSFDRLAIQLAGETMPAPGGRRLTPG